MVECSRLIQYLNSIHIIFTYLYIYLVGTFTVNIHFTSKLGTSITIFYY